MVFVLMPFFFFAEMRVIKILYQKSSLLLLDLQWYIKGVLRIHTLSNSVLAVPFPLASLKEDSKWGLRQARNPVKSF